MNAEVYKTPFNTVDQLIRSKVEHAEVLGKVKTYIFSVAAHCELQKGNWLSTNMVENGPIGE